MNDRLENLMYQAGLTAQGCWDNMDEYDHAAIKKFAELIIRECADRIRFCIKNDIDFIAEDIEKYFGVENE